MKSSELIEAMAQPADSYGTRFQPANGEYGLDRHIAWWRWGKDDESDSLVATVTTQRAPDEGTDMVTLTFRPTSLIFTKGGKLLTSHARSGRLWCSVSFTRDEQERPFGLDSAIRPYYVLFPDRESPSNPAA